MNEEEMIKKKQRDFIESLIKFLQDYIKEEPKVIEYEKIPEKVITKTDYLHPHPTDTVEHPCENCGNEIEEWVKWKKLCKRCYAMSKSGVS